MNILNKPVGKQDHYMAAFGDLTVLEIAKDGTVSVRQANMPPGAAEDLNRNLLAFYTNTSREAQDILEEQSAGVKKDEKQIVESMHYIKDIGYKILEAAEGGNLTDIGLLFDDHWKYKKRISPKMTNPHFDKIYDIAKNNGALGGKISGAGGGGFFVFYVDGSQQKFRDKMRELGLREMKYRFANEGSKVLINLQEGRI